MYIIRAYQTYLRLLRWASFSPLALKEGSKMHCMQQRPQWVPFRPITCWNQTGVYRGDWNKVWGTCTQFFAGVPQKIGFVIQFDAQRPLSKLFQLVHFAICDKYAESAARLCSPFQGEKRFCKIHRSLHEISLSGLMLSPAFKPVHKFFYHL